MSTKEEIRNNCYVELDMCCQTLCNKQDVYDYIKYLENKIDELQDKLNESEQERR
jgi:hypothetical protein